MTKAEQLAKEASAIRYLAQGAKSKLPQFLNDSGRLVAETTMEGAIQFHEHVVGPGNFDRLVKWLQENFVEQSEGCIETAGD